MHVAAPPLQVQPWVHTVHAWFGRMTYGVIRVDLARPMWRRTSSRSAFATNDMNASQLAQPLAFLQDPSGIIQGSRIKVMRCVGVGPEVPSGRQALDIGLGMNLDLQLGRFRPVLRTRILDVIRVKLAPEPLFKAKHVFPILNSGLGLIAAYRQPLNIHDLKDLGRSGVWSLSLTRIGHGSVHLSPDRIELSNQRVHFGNNVCFMFSGEVNYPRQVPSSNWRQEFSMIPSQIGMKVAW